MKLIFLGTCACDFSEKLESEFKSCLDNDARRSSSVLIDDTILVDCGDHTVDSLDILDIDYTQITDVLISHTHSDHYNVNNIEKIAKSRHVPLRLWMNELENAPEIPNTSVIKMKQFNKYELKNDYYVTALPANHDPKSHPQHFLIERCDKSVFYGCDGAWLLTDTYYYLANKKLDVMILDATVGDYEGDYRMAEHNSIPMIRLMLPSLKTNCIIDEKTKILLSHIAPSLHKSHVETQKIAKDFGADVAYDGLIMEV